MVYASEDQNRISYQPLDASKNEIRILYILQPTATAESFEEEGDIVSCDIKKVSLSDVSDKYQSWFNLTGLNTPFDRQTQFHWIESIVAGISEESDNRPDTPILPLRPGSSAESRDFDDISSKEQTKITEAEEVEAARRFTSSLKALTTDPDRDVNKNLRSLYKALNWAPSPLCFRFNWGDYVALSYCWNDPPELTQVARIKLNGNIMQVSANLEAALRALREKQLFSKGCGLWADALCINQMDLKERSSQVALMASIYGMSWGVCAWIGPVEAGNNEAIETVEALEKLGVAVEKEIQDPVTLFKPNLWTGIKSLVNKAYWRRLWIIQELAMGPDFTTVMWGSAAISFRQLSIALTTMYCYPEASMEYQGLSLLGSGRKEDEDLKTGAIIANLQLLCLQHKNSPGSTFVHDMIRTSRFAKCFDPRDKIYGLLGLMDKDLAKGITPDYAKSAQEAYTDFISSYISTYGQVEILCHSGLAAGSTFPTWVLSFEQLHHIRPLSQWDDESNISPYETFPRPWRQLHKCTCNDRKLIGTGIIFDSVDSLGTDQTGGGDKSPPQVFRKRTHAYLTEKDALDAFRRNLIGDRLESTTLKPYETAKAELAWPFNDFDEPTRGWWLQETDGKDWIRWSRQLADWQMCDRSLEDYVTAAFATKTDTPSSLTRQMFDKFSSMSKHRAIMTTKRGFFGWAPYHRRGLQGVEIDRSDLPEYPLTRRGDLICALNGCSTPLVIRSFKDGYVLLGECYVQGMMNGEVKQLCESGEVGLEEIVLY